MTGRGRYDRLHIYFRKQTIRKEVNIGKMYCEYILGKVVKFKGDTIMLYIGNFNQNF